MLAAALALYTSLAYGVGNFLAPVLMRRHAFATVLIVSQLAALAGSVLLLAVSPEPWPPLHAVGLAILAGVGNSGVLAGFYEAVLYGTLSVATPIGAASAVLPVGVGVASGEHLAAIQIAGTVLAIGGAALASRRSTEHPDEAHWDLPRCILFAAVSAVGLGTLLAALPGAADDGGLFWALVVQRTSVVACLAALIAARGETFDRPAGVGRGTFVQRSAMVVPGMLLLTGTLMYAVASDEGELSVVAVCASLAPLVTVGLAVAVLREHVSRAQLVGLVGAVIGVCQIVA